MLVVRCFFRTSVLAEPSLVPLEWVHETLLVLRNLCVAYFDERVHQLVVGLDDVVGER